MEAILQQAYISAGSNLGDRKANLDRAIDLLSGADLSVRRISSCFETEPVGYLDQPWFLNQAIEIETRLSPLELLRRCNEVEIALGRVRTFANAPRPVDLDILLYGDCIIETEKLNIPHPRMTERRFVLAPMKEIAPDVLHPVLKKSMEELDRTCPDPSTVRLYQSSERA